MGKLREGNLCLYHLMPLPPMPQPAQTQHKWRNREFVSTGQPEDPGQQESSLGWGGSNNVILSYINVQGQPGPHEALSRKEVRSERKKTRKRLVCDSMCFNSSILESQASQSYIGCPVSK